MKLVEDPSDAWRVSLMVRLSRERCASRRAADGPLTRERRAKVHEEVAEHLAAQFGQTEIAHNAGEHGAILRVPQDTTCANCEPRSQQAESEECAGIERFGRGGFRCGHDDLRWLGRVPCADRGEVDAAIAGGL